MSARVWKRLFRRFAVWSGIALGVLLLLLIGHATWRVYAKERSAATELRNQAASLGELKQRKAALEAKLRALSTERGVEEEIRDRFPVTKPGEEVITVVNPAGPAATTSAKKPSFWARLATWFAW